MSIPIAEQIDEVRREIGYRRHVYARLVIDGKMKQAQSDLRIARMVAVLETLEGIGREQQEMPL